MKKLLVENHNNIIQGVGVGLRAQHCLDIFSTYPDLPWFEVLADNYLASDTAMFQRLLKLREHYPMTLHGVGLSLGSVDPLNFAYLEKLKTLIQVLQPAWFSEHLSWSSVDQYWVPDLLPLPQTEAVIQHVVERIQTVQSFLKKRILIENVSRYISVESHMPEWFFLNAVLERADCFLLLDVNNLYVNAINHQFDPLEYISHLNLSRVKEIHLAGYSLKGSLLFDTHAEAVHPPVWNLYQDVVAYLGRPVPTLIEWDQDIPSLSRLQEEAHKAQTLIQQNTFCISPE